MKSQIRQIPAEDVVRIIVNEILGWMFIFMVGGYLANDLEGMKVIGLGMVFFSFSALVQLNSVLNPNKSNRVSAWILVSYCVIANAYFWLVYGYYAVLFTLISPFILYYGLKNVKGGYRATKEVPIDEFSLEVAREYFKELFRFCIETESGFKGICLKGEVLPIVVEVNHSGGLVTLQSKPIWYSSISLLFGERHFKSYGIDLLNQISEQAGRKSISPS